MAGILITGGTGFVGLAIAELLRARGETPVLFGLAPPPESYPGGALVEVGDVRLDADLDRAFARTPVDRVVHLAAITAGPTLERQDPRRVIDVNIGGTASVLTAAARHGVARVLVTSSVAVYGFGSPGSSGNYDEETCVPQPATLYGITKVAGEAVARRMAEVHGLDLTILRLGPVFGPWEHATGLRETLSPHAQAMALLQAGRAAVIPRESIGDWLYARDAAAGVVAALDAPAGRRRFPVYNIGAGWVWSLGAWIAACAERTSGQAGIDAAGASIRLQMAQDRAPMATNRAAEDFAYRAQFDAVASLSDYLAWIVANPNFRIA